MRLLKFSGTSSYKIMSFPELKSMSDMTAEELNYLSTVCFRDAQDVEGHLYYKGQERKAYAQTSFTLRGTKYHTRKAQLSLFLKLKEEGFQMENWGEKLTTSHLCHKKDCLQKEHLTLETLEYNRERDDCLWRGHCLGHKDRPQCLV